MHHFCKTAFVAAFVAVLPQPGFAQETTPLTQAGPRYEIKEQGDGFVRLDKQTGEMSICSVSGKNLSCRVGAEEREAYENELSLLRERIEAVEKQMMAFSNDAPAGAKKQDRITGIVPGTPEPVPPSPDSTLEETQKELDRAMDFATKAMRKFFDAIRDMRLEMEKG